MANPLESFLRGFNMVDQLETRRAYRRDLEQQREFRGEQQSQMRKVWNRQDEVWAQEDLKRIQGERRATFEATFQGVIGELGQKSEQAYRAALDSGKSEDEARRIQGKVYNEYFGNEGGEEKLFNETVKRMQLADSSVGEHFALAHGRDPAAGSLITDKANPVANIGLFPSSLNPKARGPQVFIEVNSVNDVQPMTTNRSSAANDPVDFIQPNSAGMIKFFGPEFLSSPSMALVRLREQIQAAEGDRFGDPRAVKRGEITPQQPAPGTPTPVDRAATEPGAPPPAPPGSRPTAVAEQVAPTQPSASGAPAPQQDLLLSQIEDTSELDTSANRAGKAINKAVTSASKAADLAVTQTKAKGAFNVARAGMQQAQLVSGVGSAIGEKIMRPAADFVSGLFGTDREAPKRAYDYIANLTQPVLDKIRGTGTEPEPEKVPATPKEAAQAAGEPVPSAGTLRKNPEAATALYNAATPPASEPALRQATGQLVQASQSRRRIPFPHELYNAASLVQAGLLGSDDFMRFARTGSFDAPVEAKLQLVTDNGITTVFNMRTGEPVSRVRTGPGEAPKIEDRDKPKTVQDEQALLNYFQDDIPTDNPVAKSEAISAIKGTFDILGFPNETKGDIARRADSRYVDMIKQGLRFVKKFNPDIGQDIAHGTTDWNPFSDPELEINPGSVALGTAAVLTGITDQKSADEFLYQYGVVLTEGLQDAPLSSAELFETTKNIEGFAKRYAAAANDPKNPDYQEKYKGMSVEEIRREIIEDLIAKQAGR